MATGANYDDTTGMDQKRKETRQRDNNDRYNEKMALYNKYLQQSQGPPRSRGGGGGGRKSPPPAPPAKNTGGGGGGGGRPAPTDPNEAISNKIRDKALALMSGEDSRYDDKRVNDMKDNLFSTTIGKVKGQVRAVDASMVRRGMFRSGMSARAEVDIRNNALNEYSRGVKEVLMKKADAEFDDKLKGMNATQAWLSQKQNYDLGKERNVIAREQIAASMAAAKLSAQVSREGIAASRSAAAAALGQRQREFAWSQTNDTFSNSPDYERGL